MRKRKRERWVYKEKSRLLWLNKQEISCVDLTKSNRHFNRNTVRVLFSLEICSIQPPHPLNIQPKTHFPILFRCPGNCRGIYIPLAIQIPIGSISHRPKTVFPTKMLLIFSPTLSKYISLFLLLLRSICCCCCALDDGSMRV